MLKLYLLSATVLCLYFLLLSLKNKKTLKAITFLPDLPGTPRISIIIPARNEETNIIPCLDSILNQDYPNYEVLVIDDNSNDRTWEILKTYEDRHKLIKIHRGNPLPPGWVGKQHACQQLVEKASGEYLLFTDADTIHAPQSVSWAVTNILRHNADFISAYPRQLVRTLGEALVVPAIYLMTTVLMPLWKIPERNHDFFSFAIGQFMICRRDTLLAIGGYSSFKDSLVEDMSMAREMKRRGYKTVFIDGKNYVRCRMYQSFAGAFQGFVKSMFGAVNCSIFMILGLALLLLAVVEVPVLNLIHQIYSGGDDILLSVVPVGVFLGVWFVVLRDREIAATVTISYPILFLVIILIAFTSTIRTGFLRGVEWKGRRVKCRLKRSHDANAVGPHKKRINGKNIHPLHTLSAKFVFWLTLLFVVLYDILIFHLRIKGRRNLRRVTQGGFLVSNHSLYLDPGIVAHAIAPRRTYFTALEKTFDMPFVGHYIRLLGAFPVSETFPFRSLLEVIREIVGRGKLVHFFPEGDLTRLNREMAPFKDGVFYLAYFFDKPLVPVVIKSIPKKSPLKLFFKYRVEVTICEPILPASFKQAGKGKSAVIQGLSSHARDIMERVLSA